jgi:hypothetical protein
MVRAVLLVILLAGCTSMERVEPGVFTIKDALTVIADERWNRLEPASDGAELWTADGMPLDMLAFYVGVAEGETLGPAAGLKTPRFHAAMEAHDVVELYAAILTLEGSAFKLERLAPARFGGAPGFVFDHTTVTRYGLALAGRAYGAVVDGKLYLMSYTAPRSHYYAKHLAQVEAIARSSRLRRLESAASASP